MAKGSITTLSCNPATNGFQFTEDYVTGPGGEELSMLNGSGTWQRTNVYRGGKLIGTYDLVHNPAYTPNGSQPAQVPWLHLHLEDALGTRRMQVSGMLANLAQPEMDFQSLPYGDGFSQLADQYADETYDDSSPLHFTGKERDAESGNDYFGARYYASSMGRFLSPDPKQITKQRIADPQQWNMYAYTRNNPLVAIDPDGRELRFINQEQANRALQALQSSVAPSQRSAISIAVKDGHSVMAVDAAAAKAAGADSNLGRLASVTSSEKVAQLQYVDFGEKFSVKLDGKTYSESFEHMAVKEGIGAGGITLFSHGDDGVKETSTDSKVTQVYINNAAAGAAPEATAHEIDVHVAEFFRTDSPTQSAHPAVDDTAAKVGREARENEKKK